MPNFEQAQAVLDAPVENSWQSLKDALHECALVNVKQQPRQQWLSAKTMQLIEDKKCAYHLWLLYRKEGAQMALRKENDQEHGHQNNPTVTDPWQKYRTTLNACRKSVRLDKKNLLEGDVRGADTGLQGWQAAFRIPTPQSPHGPGDCKTSQQRECQAARWINSHRRC